jgi:hypothetical protein
VNNVKILGFCFALFHLGLSAQEETPTETPKDSLQTELKDEGLMLTESVLSKVEIDPLAPSKAAFYSAVLPGLGQIYNKRYWKVPLVWGAIGGAAYGYSYNNDLYRRFREAFKSRRAGFRNDEFIREDGTEIFDQEALENQQERYQRDRDLFLLLTITAYALNIIDANVDAHLQQYNVDTNLSMDFKPYLEQDALTAQVNYGLTFTFTF